MRKMKSNGRLKYCGTERWAHKEGYGRTERRKGGRRRNENLNHGGTEEALFPGTGRTPWGKSGVPGVSGNPEFARIAFLSSACSAYSAVHTCSWFFVLRALFFVLRSWCHLRFNHRSLRCLLFILIRVDPCNSWTLRLLCASARDSLRRCAIVCYG